MSTIKQLILAGVRVTEQVPCPELATEGFDGTLTVRAITEAEEAEAEAATLSGQVMRGSPGQRPTEQEIDVHASAEGQRKGRRIRVAYGLTVGGEKWSPSEVGQLPTSVVERLDKAVVALSASDEEGQQRAATFRGLTAGTGSGAAAPDGDAAGSHPG